MKPSVRPGPAERRQFAGLAAQLVGVIEFQLTTGDCWPGVGSVSDSSVSGQPLLEHSMKHRTGAVNVVDDPNFILSWMDALNAAHILEQGTFPGDGHRQQQRVSSWIIQAFTGQATGGQKQAGLIAGERLESSQGRSACLYSRIAIQNDMG